MYISSQQALGSHIQDCLKVILVSSCYNQNKVKFGTMVLSAILMIGL